MRKTLLQVLDEGNEDEDLESKIEANNGNEIYLFYVVVLCLSEAQWIHFPSCLKTTRVNQMQIFIFIHVIQLRFLLTDSKFPTVCDSHKSRLKNSSSKKSFQPCKNLIQVISSTDEWESDDDDDEGEWIDVHHSSEEEQEVSFYALCLLG